MAITKSGGIWQRAIEIMPPTNATTTSFPTLQGISCSASGNCTMVGSYTASGANQVNQEAMGVSESGGIWGTATGISSLPTNALSDPQAVLHGISCSSAWNCSAVGRYVKSSGQEAMVVNLPPMINVIDPSSGPTSGGTQVVINGSNFLGVTSVDFGSIPATSFTVINSYQIKAVVPPVSSAQIVTISVIGPDGTSSPSTSSNFLYVNPGVLYPESPVRIVDTRPGATDPSTYAGQTLGPGQTLNVSVVGANNDNVTSNASAVVANITAVHPTSSGYLTVYPTGLARPNTSNLNFLANENAVANLVQVPLGQNGDISIYNAFGDANVLVDVEGYIGPATSSAGLFNPLSKPARIADTRHNSGYQYQNSTLGPSGSINVKVEGEGGVPSTGVSAVVINLTATNTTANGGYLVAYPEGAPTPQASSVNFDADQSVPNRVIVALGTNGSITIKNAPFGYVDVIVDVSGWFSDSSLSTGYEFHPVSPQRIADTRIG